MIEPRIWHSGSKSDPIVSYSQNAEDVRLWRVFGGIDDGFYVDIGAGDPVLGSVTQLFYERGWSGINVEPSPAFDALDDARERDVNLSIAIGENDGETAFFLTYPDLGMSTVDPEVHVHVPEAVERTEEIVVPQRRLATVLREHVGDRTIHFLKVDVEGAERDVLASSDWDAFRPIVVLVEAVESWSTTPSHEAWEQILLDADYEFAAFDGINRFYVSRAHRELIPALAYPMGALDHYVPVSVHEQAVNAAEFVGVWEGRLQDAETRAQEAETRAQDSDLRTQAAETRVGELEAQAVTADEQRRALGVRVEHLQQELTRVQDDLRERQVEVEELRRSRVHTQAELSETRHELHTVYRSPTWRAGLLIALAGRPLLRLGRTVRRPVLRTRRARSPAQAYARAVARGQPWHYPRRLSRLRLKLDPSPLKDVVDRFGPPNAAVDHRRAMVLAERLQRLGWNDEESLHARRLSWEERQAAIEADAIVGLVTARDDDDRDTAPGVLRSGRPTVVVDARCLQEPMYATRGVGLHGRSVLQALRRVATGFELVLLTSADLPDLDLQIAEMADQVVCTPYATNGADVRLFLQLSPMTASCTAAVPFLARSGCVTASVVFDFIPTEFPAAYLASPVAALTNRARIEALRHYDLLLPISRATDAACRRYFGQTPATVVSGVGDPLHGVTPAPEAVEGRFMLVPGGGDPRKNIAAAVAALASHRRTGSGLLRAVVTGVLTDHQASALTELGRALGLPDNAVELRGYVGNAELAGLYQAADLVVVPSVTEGFSIPVVEAVIRGIPVVASDIPAHSELVGPGPWLAPAADVEALAGAIGEARRAKEHVIREQQASLGDTADPSKVVDRIAAALEPLLEQHREPAARRRSRSARPRIAVVTPFPPQKTGVGDYTAYTFLQVARYAEVEVYTGASTDQTGTFQVHALSAAPYLARRFDAVVNVLGNSHLNFPMLDFLGCYGGACISHDNRMLEAYRFDRGNAWTAKLLSRSGYDVLPEDVEDLMLNLDRLPTAAYDLIARQASPLIVHGRSLAERILRETDVRPVVVPFVPYNVPNTDEVDEQARAGSRRALGLSDDVFHIGSFGIVDSRTKGSDLIVGALSWLRSWGRPVHVHFVGDANAEEQSLVDRVAAEFGVAADVTVHGHVTAQAFKDFLLGVDAAVQIRKSTVLSLSGALADCIAFGVPTVTTQDVADEMDAPSYVATTGAATSSLLIAEAVDGLCELRRTDAPTIEAERRAYLAERSVDAYARGLLEGLGLWSEQLHA